MSRYDDTFQHLLYQLNETPAKPTDKCPANHVWKIQPNGKWKCVKKTGITTYEEPTRSESPLGEAEQQAPTINVDPVTWDTNFENIFASDTIDKAPDRDIWGDKVYTINVAGTLWDVYDVQSEEYTGIIIPDPDETGMVHFFKDANSQYLANLLTGQ